MKEYHFKSSTPPTITNRYVFSNIPSDCVIYVPQGSLTAYQTATSWSTYASQMQEEPASWERRWYKLSTTTNLEHLVINYLTEAQYEAALSNNQINENQLYITPFSSDDLANYTAGDGIDITNKIISVDSNLTV